MDARTLANLRANNTPPTAVNSNSPEELEHKRLDGLGVPRTLGGEANSNFPSMGQSRTSLTLQERQELYINRK